LFDKDKDKCFLWRFCNC